MDLVAIKSDLAFRAVFGRECEKCKQALIALLNDVLNLNITALRYDNPLNLQNFEDDKKSEMDIEVITDRGERIDIEIQLLRMRGFEERMVYYGGKLINESLENGEDYEKMKKCKVLSIVDFTLFTDNEKVQNCFRFKEVEDNFELTDVLEIVFLEMGKLDETLSIEELNVVEKWLYFLKHVDDPQRQEQIQEILRESEGINVAMEILKEVSADEQLRTRIRFQEKAERDRIALLNSARLDGREEEKKEIAKKALDMLDDQSIVQLTGLPLEEVRTLRISQQKETAPIKE